MANSNTQNGPDEFLRMLAASAAMLGRFQSPELFHSQAVSFAAPVTVQIPRPLNLTRPLEEIGISLRFRVGVTVAPYAAVAPEAPQNILQNVNLTGIHRTYGSLTPINMSGASLYAIPHIFQSRPNAVLIGVGGGAQTQAAEPSKPFTSPFLGTVANHDVEIYWHIPMAPQMGIDQNLKRQETSFMFLPQDWSDSLRLTLQFGDASALGDPTGATVAFTAFGSAAGTPQLEVHLNYSILGPFANRMPSGVRLLNESVLTQFVALATRTRLLGLQHQITTNVFTKTGTIQTAGLTAGVTTLAALSDVQLDNTKIIVDNKPLRDYSNNRFCSSYISRMFGKVVPQGYLCHTFVDGQNVSLAYRGDGLAGGSQFELFSDVISASANNRQFVTQEIIIGGPFPSLS